MLAMLCIFISNPFFRVITLQDKTGVEGTLCKRLVKWVYQIYSGVNVCIERRDNDHSNKLNDHSNKLIPL